jgi:hypothetical protein
VAPPDIGFSMLYNKLCSHPLTGGNMKYILLAALLLLNACDNSSPAPKIAAPQREALEKAKGVDQAVQKDTEESKKKIEDAEK